MKKIISAVLALSMTFLMSVCAYARLVGDVNRNGSVNSSDALEVLRYSVGSIMEIDILMADIDKNGEINSGDALRILQIAVGSYTGELEVEDELVTSYKKDVIDPIVKTGKYTISTFMVSDGDTVPAVIMVNGNNMSIDMKFADEDLDVNCRALFLDGNIYLIFPILRVYGTINNMSAPSIIGKDTEEYVKSEYYELNGEKYVREIYKSSDGSVKKYYFLDGVWKATETIAADGTTSTQNINDFKAGVVESNFSLKGYFKVADLSKYIK